MMYSLKKIRDLKSILNVSEKKLRNYHEYVGAVDAVYDFWGVLVMTPEHKFEVNKTNEAKGILKKIKSFNFFYSCNVM